jgi:hypothetical protein
MTPLYQRQCLNHAHREAVARCPECGRFYCRECVAEHEDRLLCAGCIRKLVESPGGQGRWALAWPGRAAALGLSLVIGWLAFYLAGRVLLSIPASVHDGTLWQRAFLDQ